MVRGDLWYRIVVNTLYELCAQVFFYNKIIQQPAKESLYKHFPHGGKDS